MRKSRFSEEKIIVIQKEHQAGMGAKELCRKHGISDRRFIMSLVKGRSWTPTRMVRFFPAGRPR